MHVNDVLQGNFPCQNFTRRSCHNMHTLLWAPSVDPDTTSVDAALCCLGRVEVWGLWHFCFSISWNALTCVSDTQNGRCGYTIKADCTRKLLSQNPGPSLMKVHLHMHLLAHAPMLLQHIQHVRRTTYRYTMQPSTLDRAIGSLASHPPLEHTNTPYDWYQRQPPRL